MSTGAKVTLWILTVLFVLFGYVTIPYASAALFFLAALLLLPIERWQKLLGKVLPKKWINAVLVVLLFLAALLLLPADFGEEPAPTSAVEATLPPTPHRRHAAARPPAD